jgi:hypothetical protein
MTQLPGEPADAARDAEYVDSAAAAFRRELAAALSRYEMHGLDPVRVLGPPEVFAERALEIALQIGPDRA